MDTIETLLRGAPIFDGLEPGALSLIAGCASNVHLDQGSVLFREGEQADTFYLVRHGSVALDVAAAEEDPVLDSDRV